MKNPLVRALLLTALSLALTFAARWVSKKARKPAA
jgi:hypothetical protein